MRVVIALTRLDGDEHLQELARPAVAALAACAGCRRVSFGRAADDPHSYVLLSEWADIGSYRRALSSYDVRMQATPLFAHATADPGAYEELLWAPVQGSADAAGAVAGGPTPRLGEADSDRDAGAGTP